MDISLRCRAIEEKAALTAFIATAFAAAFHHRALRVGWSGVVGKLPRPVGMKRDI